jgi:hypothetical protein
MVLLSLFLFDGTSTADRSNQLLRTGKMEADYVLALKLSDVGMKLGTDIITYVV